MNYTTFKLAQRDLLSYPTFDLRLIAKGRGIDAHAKKDLVNEYTSVVMESGLEPAVCDLDAFAVENMFEANYGSNLDGTVVLVRTAAR